MRQFVALRKLDFDSTTGDISEGSEQVIVADKKSEWGGATFNFSPLSKIGWTLKSTSSIYGNYFYRRPGCELSGKEMNKKLVEIKAAPEEPAICDREFFIDDEEVKIFARVSLGCHGV